MSELTNPYATALDGLEIDDPVAAFFRFCRERARVRVLREPGAPAPWTEDPILQRGRFLNLFREDDRGRRAILRFAAPVRAHLPTLVQALFFARWCNRQATLDVLSADVLADPARLRRVLETEVPQPWCNVTAYPVEPVCWEGTLHSRIETATELFFENRGFLRDAILSGEGSVVRATAAVNAGLGMRNDFPIFMAVMDLAWFRPDVVDPASPVPTGIGAVAFLDRLQRHLGLEDHHETCARMIALAEVHWPEARRRFQPIDIEYLACECRKYFSYVNGTKAFEGKNVFRPGESAQLVFDVPADAVPTAGTPTGVHVVAGGPCSGKTTLLEALAEAGHRVEYETAERVLKAGIDRGRSADALRADPVEWQRTLLEQDFALFDGLPTDACVFTDTSFVETLVFGARAGITIGPNVEAWLRRKRYATVFFLDPLRYERSAVRVESQRTAARISDEVRAAYRRYGYELVVVPAMPVAERLAFIQSIVGDTLD